MKNLIFAHKGYNYQDICTALILSDALISKPEIIYVDKKKYNKDIFDDLTVRYTNNVCKYQFKFLDDPHRNFSLKDITTKQTKIRIDDLISSVSKDPDYQKTKYYVVTTLLLPVDELKDLIEVEEGNHPLGHYVCRLIPEKIWPAHAKKSKLNIRNKKSFTKKAFLDFCEKFRLILSSPRPSFYLENPGDLENVLFEHLINKIGIGVYPNKNTNAKDAAARLITLATKGRVSIDKTGGRIAKRARLELESKTKKKVVTKENFLPPHFKKTLKGDDDK